MILRKFSLRQLVLTVLTVFVVLFVGSSLVNSFSEPQITSRLQLYQTDLLLRATELAFPAEATPGLTPAQSALLGSDPYSTALKQYNEVRQLAQHSLETFQARLDQASTIAPSEPATAESHGDLSGDPLRKWQTLITQQQALINQLDIRQGLIYVQQDQLAQAQQLWNHVLEQSTHPGQGGTTQVTAQVLLGLWNDPPRLLPDAEQSVQQNLEGWFRYQALSRLYELQQRQDALAELQTTEQAIARQTFVKLAIVGLVPIVGCIIGVGLVIGLIVQRVTQGKQALIAQNSDLHWDTPWNGEIIWQVLIAFFVAQILVSFVISAALKVTGIDLSQFGTRGRAFYTLVYYLLMSGTGLTVLYLSVRSFRPLSKDWFRISWQGKWFWWGLGGYLVALPLMIGVALVNQQLWQGQGGSNPLLQIVLEERDPIALGIFFSTAAIAAPFFEEILFRGFLLSSLTRYVPVGAAIAISAVMFAIAHLSLSEVIPLAVLGSVLGFVYTRSRNLLAPMVLHSLWNSGTLLSLFILGSGSQ